MSTVKVGTTGRYVSSKGYDKFAFVVGTHESVKPDGSIVVPDEGHVHLVVFGLTTGFYVSPNVPLHEVAETLPDYTLDGQLVGYFEAV